MNLIIEQLLDIFSEIIRRNSFITFAYSRLEDRWYYLSMKYEDTYDCAEVVTDPYFAYKKMLDECRYCWLKENGLLHPDLSLKENTDFLPPDIARLLWEFTAPYEQAAQKVLAQYHPVR